MWYKSWITRCGISSRSVNEFEKYKFQEIVE